MSNVTILKNVTRLDIPADRVIDAAKEKALTAVVIIGYDPEGEEYFASSYADGGDVLWLLERMKKMLLEVPEKIAERGI